MTNETPPALTTLSREITLKLIRRVVDEVYPPGTKLPTERDLSAEFGVTRHVVREALKRLEALGMVSIRQGSGILVEDLQLTGGMELTRSLLKRSDGSFDIGFLKELLDFRAQIGQTIVRLAAENRTSEELEKIKALVVERKRFFNDPEKLNEVNAKLFGLFADATHNRIYKMVLNTIGRAALELRAKLQVPIDVVAQVQRLLEQIVEAMELQDGEVAALLAARHGAIMRRYLAAAADESQDEPPASE